MEVHESDVHLSLALLQVLQRQIGGEQASDAEERVH